MPQGVQINPRILSWARETAGLSLEEAAEKFGFKDSARTSAVQKLRSLESGERTPSEAHLQKASDVYRRPLLSFYLPEPPQRGERGDDFRTITGSVSQRENGLLDALIRDVRARQQMLREVLIDNDEATPLTFIASANIEEGAISVAASIRGTLGVTQEGQRLARGSGKLFGLLRSAAEQVGIYVLLLGDVGSHHSDISEEVFRGFAIADDIAPFVVINDNDAVNARAFTLMHELAHLWIGASGVSGPLKQMPENVIERFCNDVAGEFLLPRQSLAEIPPMTQADLHAVMEATARLADDWNISQGVVAYRFVTERRISAEIANALFEAFTDRWRKEKQRARESKDSNQSGPSYYVVRRHRLGAGLLSVVRRAVQGDVLSHTRAGKILGVSPSAVDQLLYDRVRVA